MAIIDRNSVFFEGPLTANATGQPVALTGLKLPGRMEPMPLRFSVTEAFAPDETQSLTISMEEADHADGPWAAVPGASVTVHNPTEAPGLGLGARPYLRFLPQGVRKSWLRLAFAVTPVDGKTVSKGCIFAALTREEDLPYEPAIMAG